MYTMTNIESIIDTQIVVIFDEEFGIILKDDSHTQLITVKKNYYNYIFVLKFFPAFQRISIKIF